MPERSRWTLLVLKTLKSILNHFTCSPQLKQVHLKNSEIKSICLFFSTFLLLRLSNKIIFEAVALVKLLIVVILVVVFEEILDVDVVVRPLQNYNW